MILLKSEESSADNPIAIMLPSKVKKSQLLFLLGLCLEISDFFRVYLHR